MHNAWEGISWFRHIHILVHANVYVFTHDRQYDNFFPKHTERKMSDFFTELLKRKMQMQYVLSPFFENYFFFTQVEDYLRCHQWQESNVDFFITCWRKRDLKGNKSHLCVSKLILLKHCFDINSICSSLIFSVVITYEQFFCFEK